MTVATLHLTLIEPDRNCYRYYEISLQPGLFQEWSLIRAWGRIGTKGCGKTVWFSSREQAETFYERKRREKLRRGYLPTLFPVAAYYQIEALGRPEIERERRTPSKKRLQMQAILVGQQELFNL